MYLDVVAQLDPTVRLPPDLLPMVRSYLTVGDHERVGGGIPCDVLDPFALAGIPDDVAARAQVLYDAGAQRVEFGAPYGLTHHRRCRAARTACPAAAWGLRAGGRRRWRPGAADSIQAPDASPIPAE